MARQKVLILGAGGYLGRHLMSALALTSDFQPVGSTRKAPPASLSGEWIWVDALDEVSLKQALASVDAVVNCVTGDDHTIRQGAINLTSAAKQVRRDRPLRIVYMSSMAVYGSATGILSESTPLCIDAGWHGQAKCDAEHAMDAYRDEGGDVVIFRPGCIFSADSGQWGLRIARLLWQRRIGDLGSMGDGPSNLVHVDDVVQAIVLALRARDLPTRVFNLACPDAPSWNGYFIGLGVAMGATPVKRISRKELTVDTKMVSIGLKGLEIIASKLRLNIAALPVPMPPSLLRLWGQDIKIDSSVASETLGIAWTPFGTALAKMSETLKAQRRP